MDVQHPDASPPSGDPTPSTIASPRSRKQFSLFLAGATFFALSTAITRRSLRKRRLATFPSFYRPSNAPPARSVNGAIEAFEALNIATVNVASVMMMVTGGLLWAFDISSLDDLRRKVRGGLGVDGSGRAERQAEEEFEEWLATVLERKRGKEEERKRDKGEGRVLEELMNERGRPR